MQMKMAPKGHFASVVLHPPDDGKVLTFMRSAQTTARDHILDRQQYQRSCQCNC